MRQWQRAFRPLQPEDRFRVAALGGGLQVGAAAVAVFKARFEVKLVRREGNQAVAALCKKLLRSLMAASTCSRIIG